LPEAGTVVERLKDHERREPGGLLRLGNERARSFERVMMNFEPYDVATPPCVLGSDLIEYLALASMGTPGRPDLWDPFTEAAHVIDPHLWYTTSFDATPERSVTRWVPPNGSGLATVAVYSQGSETAVLIRHGSPGRSNRGW
jgi:hypothetical protein